MTGSVLAIYVAPVGKATMESVITADVEEGRGIRGDRYYSQAGTFSDPARIRPDQEITLVESEAIDEFNRSTGSALDYGAARRNLVTKDVRLNALVGARFYVGQVLLEGIRLCEPCAHLAALVSPHVLPGLVRRAGLRARILSSGQIGLSDAVAPA